MVVLVGRIRVLFKRFWPLLALVGDSSTEVLGRLAAADVDASADGAETGYKTGATG